MSLSDRFAVPAAILRGFQGASGPADSAAWLGLLGRAGIHPASLPLCCQGANFPWIEPLRHTLERLDPAFQFTPVISFDTIVAWSPLTYAHEVEAWNLRSGPGGLPDNLLAIRGLTVQDDPEVRELGRGWALVGRLQLLELPRLRTLRGPLEVFGDLELAGLPHLRELGPGITVHGNLTVAGCPALEGLPGDLRVDGAIWLDAAFPGVPPALAGRIRSPWPGIQPGPVAIAAFPPGALELSSR
jgi:hypothetical protein